MKPTISFLYLMMDGTHKASVNFNSFQQAASDLKYHLTRGKAVAKYATGIVQIGDTSMVVEMSQNEEDQFLVVIVTNLYRQFGWYVNKFEKSLHTRYVELLHELEQKRATSDQIDIATKELYEQFQAEVTELCKISGSFSGSFNDG